MKIYKITEASERRPYPSSEAQEIAGLKDAKDGQEV